MKAKTTQKEDPALLLKPTTSLIITDKVFVSLNMVMMHRVRAQNRIERDREEDMYIQMLLDLDRIPWYHSVGATLFGWLLLAGYVVIPGTFTSLKRSKSVEEHLSGSEPQRALLNAIRNPPLLAISSVFFTVGCSGLFWLGCTWRRNYIWLVNQLIM